MNVRIDQGRATRDRLVEVALQLFVEQGYDAIAIPAVLDAAGVSRGALYHHFESKEALFEAVLERVEADLADRVGAVALSTDDPVTAMRLGGHEFLRLAAHDPVVHQIVLIDAPAVVGWDEWRSIDEQYGFGLLKGVVQLAADEGLIPAEQVDPLSHLLLAAMNELAQLIARSKHPRKALAEARATYDFVLDRLFAA